MTPADFRRIALSMPGAEEGLRAERSEFRVGSRTFATLAGLDEEVAVIFLTRDQQSQVIGEAPAAFAPVPGGDGNLGATHVRVGAVETAILTAALTASWTNVAPMPPPKVDAD
jgi:hypothetical protein